jgi:hypothetical protein
MQNSREKAEMESIYGGEGERFCIEYLVSKLAALPAQ